MTDYRYDTGEDSPPPPAERRRYNPSLVRDDAAFEKAQRHSRSVRRLRIILPVLAVLGVGALWATARIIPGDLKSLVAISGIDVKSNSVIMQKPHISGFEGTRRAYEVKADTAVQSLSDPKVITFNKIVGHFGLDQAGEATINAGVGIYDGHTNTLALKGDINMQTTNGYAGKFAQANIDIGKGTMTSTKPLQLSMAEGSIRANAMTVSDRGKQISFSNGVSVTYLPPGELVTATGTTTQSEPQP